ncbi:MAG: NUDIX hydrolase [Planctomycetaceae bacterium]|nr:NUDIX hydrolase [Planctomycetaceae bacterium]
MYRYEVIRVEIRDELLLKTRRFNVVNAFHQVDANTVESREVIRHPGAVTVLPWVNQQQVCLIRNFRIGVGRALVELPAGTLEPGESPGVCAQRELAEETGFSAASWRKLHTFYLSPGILDERMHLFLAKEMTPGPSAREQGEHIENLIVDWEEALDMAETGEIQDAKTLLGILYFDHLLRLGHQ